MKAGAGMALLLLLLTPIFWSTPAALMTAELASAIPEEGGYYVWVKRALGQPWGFLCGWWTWVFSWVDAAIYPTLFVAYLGRFWGLVGHSPAFDSSPWLKWLVGLAIIIPITILNLLGTKRVGEGSISFFILLLTPFVLLVLFGISQFLTNPGAATHPFVAPGSDSGAFSVGLFAVMWNYLGWDSMSSVAGEVENPQKNIPKALMVGVPLVALTYILPTLVGLAVLRKPDQWDEGAWVQVAISVGGHWLGIAIAAAGIVSSAGMFSATLLACSRIPFVLAQDGYLPSGLTKLHPRFGSPVGAILVSACFYTVFSFQSFNDLTVVDVVVYSAALTLEFVALVVLRKKEPNLERPFKIRGGFAVSILVGLIPTVLIMAAVVNRFQEKGKVAMVVSILALMTGPIVYGLGAFSRRNRGEVAS